MAKMPEVLMNNWQVIGFSCAAAAVAAIAVRSAGRVEGDRNFSIAQGAANNTDLLKQESENLRMESKQLKESIIAAQIEITELRNAEKKVNVKSVGIISTATILAPLILSAIPGASPIVLGVCTAIQNLMVQ